MPVAKETSRRKWKNRRQIPALLAAGITARAEWIQGPGEHPESRVSTCAHLPTLGPLQTLESGTLFRVVSGIHQVIVIGHYRGLSSIVQENPATHAAQLVE